jgi:hypothetical protein
VHSLTGDGNDRDGAGGQERREPQAGFRPRVSS